MSENLERIKRIILKLQQMNLERGCTPAEAAGAALKIQELLEKHQLSLLDIQSGKLNEDMANKAYNTGRKRGNPGESALASAIANGCDCKLIHDWDEDGCVKLRFLGFVSDVEVANYLFSYLVKGLIQIANQQGYRANVSGPRLIRWRNNFLCGAAGEIRRRLYERKTSKPQTLHTRQVMDNPNLQQPSVKPNITVSSTALVAIKTPAVDQFVQEQYPKLRHLQSSKMNWNSNALEAGRKAGREIPLRKAMETSSPNLLT